MIMIKLRSPGLFMSYNHLAIERFYELCCCYYNFSFCFMTRNNNWTRERESAIIDSSKKESCHLSRSCRNLEVVSIINQFVVISKSVKI